jgi:hypothetical protein
MKRRLLNLLTLLSLLLCVAVATLWVRSYSVEDELRAAREGIDYRGMSILGRVRITRLRQDYRQDRALKWSARAITQRFDFGDVLHLVEYQASPNGEFREWAVPYWLPCLVLGVPAGAWTIGRHRRQRMRDRASKGLCPRCGYDLRATPGRCPECGWTASVSTTA